MMAADSNRFTRIIAFISLLFLHIPPSSSQCTDGTYKHDGRDCCRCGIGQRVVEHCITNLTRGTCEECEHGTYSSDPNNQEFCDPCTSCSQPNANLEEDKPCTPARDTKCRCIKDHYCASNIEICRLCHPCKKCTDGIKVPCAGNNNTVCNEKSKENPAGPIIGGIFGFIAVVGIVGVAVFIWKKSKKKPAPLANGNAADLEMQLLNDVDLQPHLSDIADMIGWKDMQDVAMRRNMPSATIDAFKLNHPGDSQEQTLQLLRAWVEREGREAGKILVQVLQNSGKKDKAQKVADKLSRGN